MGLYNKLKIIYSAFISVVKRAYSAKLLERQLNRKGYDIHIGHDYTVTNTVFEKHVRLYGPGKIANCKVGAYTYVQSGSNISNADIGRFCSIGPRVIIAHGEHPSGFLSTHPLFFSEYSAWNNAIFVDRKIVDQHKQVSIGHDVWIGANCYIKDGVKIGTGSIIAAGAVVVKDVPPYAIMGGVPAKVIRFRFDDNTINDLLKTEWWACEMQDLLRLKSFFQTDMNNKMARDFLGEIVHLKK